MSRVFRALAADDGRWDHEPPQLNAGVLFDLPFIGEVRTSES
jgi:hypothetical protein